MYVAKFGGSSVANAEQIKKIGSIIIEDSRRKFIVVSAPGKRFKDDSKTTDLLIQLGEAALSNKPYEKQLALILDRFTEIVKDLNLTSGIVEHIRVSILEIIESDQSDQMKMDALKSIGEDSSARVVSEYLQTQGMDAHYVNPKDAGIIVSNDPGQAQILPGSFSKLYEMRNRTGTLVIPGFFGFTVDGQLMTFSRGGSDITGSIVAAGVKADLYENFTDVNSVYCVNPAFVDQPKEITSITYREMRELSYAGFSVFHDEALIPAFKQQIPVCIKNTNNPKAPGTMIVAEKNPNGNCVAGIASDTGFSSIYVSKYLMNRELGFGRKLLQIFEDEEISFEHAPSGIDEMSVIIRDQYLPDWKEKAVIQRIENELDPDTIKVDHDLAMIMVVGEGMASTVGIAKRATTAISNAGVNIEMINQGSSEVSMMFGIHSNDLKPAIQSLYTAFFEDEAACIPSPSLQEVTD